MVLACILMYTIAATHCILGVYWIFADNNKSLELQQRVVQCLLNVEPCTLPNKSLSTSTNQCVLAPLLMVNVSVR